VKFRDRSARDKGSEEIGRATSEFDLKPQDDSGEYRVIAVLRQQSLIATEKATVEQNITTLRNRVNELGVSEPIVQQQGADRIVVQLPGIQDTARAKDILGRTATLEFRMVEAQMTNPSNRDYDPNKVQAAINGNPPIGTELLYDVTKEGGKERREPLVLTRRPVITGDRLAKASPTLDQRTNQPVVKGKPEVLTAPVIQGEFAGNFQISGNFTTQSATNLALLLRAGALAAPMEIVEERTVGPSLGADNIRLGVHSVWAGFALIATFMILYYRVFGLISIFALATNLLLLVALLSVQLIQATLTLPGIAAIALALGMAIDANVLINERIREELRNGNTPQAAINAGYERAWATILDSNVTTLIAGLALLAFGSGPVRGFAVVHCLGILTSMFSAVVVSRGVVNLYYGRQRRLEAVSIGQVWRPDVKGAKA
jgi:preprotein translocase subunit SecD